MKRLLFAVALVAAMFAAGSAQAATVIDFGTGQGVGGTITVSGSLYTGTGIAVPVLKITGAPQNNSATGYLTDAVLSFAYDGGANNWVKVVGAFSPAGILAGSTLLSGSFTSFTSVGTPNGISVTGVGPDTKNATLLTYIGLPTNTPFALFGFSMGATSAAAANVYDTFSTDVSNTAVPEPGSMLLLGTGLFGLAGAVRRRLKK
jgi:hypothetical protein